MLKELKNFVDTMNSTNSAKAKQEILSSGDHDNLKELLSIIYDPFKPFFMTKNSLTKFMKSYAVPPTTPRYSNLMELLNGLANREVTGHSALEEAYLFINEYDEDHQVVFFNILAKNLKIGIGAKQLNKVWGGLTAEFSVALADTYNPDKHTLDEDWLIMQKLDGVRMITIIEGDEQKIKCLSRSGKEFETVDLVKTEIKRLLGERTNLVIDGEMGIFKNGLIDFQSTMTEIQRKNHTIDTPAYIVFDMIPLEHFKNKVWDMAYDKRLYYAENVIGRNNQIVNVIDYEICTPQGLANAEEVSQAEGWEGLIARKKVAYEGKRSKSLLKLKKFVDDEYTVIGVEHGEDKFLDPVTGKKTRKKCVNKLIIEHKGEEVRVGSGLSESQKLGWLNNESKIIGQTITVKYFEESTDKNGKKSLRFPVLKTIHGKKREV